jgi:anti-sigma B factor antagonist
MQINKLEESGKITLGLIGKLDSSSFHLLDQEIEKMNVHGKTVVLDLKELEYISSAGLRVVLKLKKIMDRVGKLEVINPNELVLEVFEITGFSTLLGL